MTDTSTLDLRLPDVIELRMKFTPPRAMAFRIWLASQVFHLGGLIVGFNVEVDVASRDAE